MSLRFCRLIVLIQWFILSALRIVLRGVRDVLALLAARRVVMWTTQGSVVFRRADE